MEQMKFIDSLAIREKKKYLGVPENWKIRPVCCLSDISEEEVYYAALGGAAMGIGALSKVPSFTLYFLNRKGEEIFYFEKRSGLFSNKMEVFDAAENLTGSVQKQGGSRTAFQALDAGRRVLYDIEATSAAPEIFQIRKGSVTAGKISRRPTRIAEEGVFRNDHFGITFPLDAEIAEKSILLGVLFLIDFLS